MRQLSILVIALLLAGSAFAADMNCTGLTAPSTNFYKPSMACMNDTAVKACYDAETACHGASSSCTASMTCISTKLRCLEQVVTTDAACASWTAAFQNEKLYLAAGGEYNQSSLELSCKLAVCAYTIMPNAQQCPKMQLDAVCVDPGLGTNVSETPVGTGAPSGAVQVEWKITGDKAAFVKMLAEKSKAEIDAVIIPILTQILGTADFTITGYSVASLIVYFYSSSLSESEITSKIATAAANGAPAGTFDALATLAGVEASSLGVGEVTTTIAGAPTPTSGAMAVSCVAVLAAIAALLL